MCFCLSLCAESGSRAVTYVSEGAAVPGHRLRVVAPGTERELGERELGEILLAGPSVSPRDFGADPASARAELRTGDLGYLAAGRLFVVDRLKDLIVIAGQKYHPADIESTIEPLCDVKNARAAAFAVAGEGTEALCIAIELSGAGRELAPELRERIVRTLRAQFGVSPREIVCLPRGTLPRTTSGKIQRRLCRRLYEDGALHDAGAAAIMPPMSKTDLESTIAPIARKHLGHDVTLEEARAHLKGVKLIVAADGFSDAEAAAMHKVMVWTGLPAELIAEVEAWDPSSARLEDILPKPISPQKAKELLRGAVRIASVDGYSDAERAKTREAAGVLGVPERVVEVIEALVELERKVEALGHAKLAGFLTDLYRSIFESDR
jgi:tellurite resistance protein